jgi:hypothetical protein
VWITAHVSKTGSRAHFVERLLCHILTFPRNPEVKKEATWSTSDSENQCWNAHWQRHPSAWWQTVVNDEGIIYLKLLSGSNIVVSTAPQVQVLHNTPL